MNQEKNIQCKLDPNQCMDETQAKGENTLKWNKKCTNNVFEGENTLCK